MHVQMRHACNTSLENTEGKSHLEDLRVDGKLILKWILKEYGVRMWTLDTSASGHGSVADTCEHGSESLSWTAEQL
jgi:hypothetical protein